MPKALKAVCAIALLGTTLNAGAQSTAGEANFRELYKELIETNTTLSNGSCTLAAERMAARLKAAGFADSDLHPFAAPGHPKEGGLVAIYPGRDPKLKALLLLAHIDVVEAKREDWTRDPFKLVEENGNFYARGVIDDKAEAAIWVDTLVRYKRENYRPRRTIKLALTCGEETAGAFNGAQYLVEHERDLIDAAFAVNEGAWGELDAEGHKVVMEIQAGEKTAQNYRLEVTNPGGHSSRPLKDNAIYRLAAALLRVEGYVFPAQFTDGSRAYFTGMAKIQAAKGNTDVAEAMRALVKDPNDANAIALVSAKDPSLERHAAHHLRRHPAGCGSCHQCAAAACAGEYQLPHLPGSQPGNRAQQTRGTGRGSEGGGLDFGDSRAELAAAAFDFANSGTGRETHRGVLSRRAGVAHLAARRHRRGVLERGRHPHLWHRALVRRPRSRPRAWSQRVCQREIADGLP